MTTLTLRIYGDAISGNCQKVKFTADWLRLDYEWIAVDIMKGETRTSEFLARNPQGQVPVAEFADGRCLAQSDAIVRHLARDSALIPTDPFDRAKADEWMFWEQYSHEPYVAVARFQTKYLGKPVAALEKKLVQRGDASLNLMERAIAARRFFIADRFSVADIALLPYTRMVEDGGFDLGRRQNLRAWISRCEHELGLG